MANTHFSGPVLYSGTGSFTGPWGKDLPIGVNLGVFELFDDFLGVSTTPNATNWNVAVKDTDASATVTQAEVGGVLDLNSKATTDDDGASIQGNRVFQPAADKIIWFETRLQNNKVDQSDIGVGLTSNFTTDPEALFAANRIAFQVDDGSAVIKCVTRAAGVSTTTTTSVSMVNDTYITLSIQVTGTGLVQFYINRNLVAQHTTNIPAIVLTIGAASISGDNLGTRRTRIDYLFAAQTR